MRKDKKELEIKGHSIPKHEKDVLNKVYKKNQNKIQSDTIDSLLYNLVKGGKKDGK